MVLVVWCVDLLFCTLGYTLGCISFASASLVVCRLWMGVACPYQGPSCVAVCRKHSEMLPSAPCLCRWVCKRGVMCLTHAVTPLLQQNKGQRDPGICASSMCGTAYFQVEKKNKKHPTLQKQQAVEG